MFCHFWQKFENSKWPFLGRGKFFLKLPRVQCSDTLWVENFDEIALSRTVKEIEANAIMSHCLYGEEVRHAVWRVH